MLDYDDKIYDSFVESENRARAMLIIQNTMDAIHGYFKGDKNLLEYLKDKYPESKEGIELISQMISTLKMTQVMQREKLEEFGEQTEETLSQFDEEELEKIFQPLIDFIESLETISEEPLNKEAVVTSVTAFETYLKDRLIDVVSNNQEIEKRFTDELKEGLTYDKVKEYNRDWNNLLGYVVSENVGSFFDVDEIERIYKRVLGKRKDDDYSLYKSERQKKMLKNYIELRHIIVHNSGIVDHKFSKITNGRYEIGEKYEINKKHVETMIGVMENIVDKIENELKEI